jgi:leucyl aminopeptidase (aminopeptidase T)
MPAGKAAITPEREKAEGVIVVDGSLGSLGMVRNPIELRIRNGNITKIFGGEEALFLRKTLRIHGKNTRCIAELGIGTNPNATLTGESEEDEKTLGTVYLTLGNSMPDGSEDERHAPVNLILRKPSLKIDGRPIIENGTLLV